MLRKIRKILALIFFVLGTLLFLDFTGTIHKYWMAELQLVPAILGVKVGVIVILALLTLFFGRVYCSIICPLGVFMDIVAKIGRRGKKLPYKYSAAKSVLRYVMLGVFVVAIVAGVSVVVSLLDPYAAYGRMANTFLQPLWIWGNNILAYFAERADSYAFYNTEVWTKSVWVFIVAIITFIAISILAWRNGRTYCNTICPVGTILGFVSRYSFFRISMDADKCNQCRLCSGNCKAACIDEKSYTVDTNRCVTCMNCIGRCKKGAIDYKFALNKSKNSAPKTETESNKDDSRRGFITSIIALAAASAKAQVLPKAVEMKMDGGLADILPKQSPIRETMIVPPGGLSLRNFKNKCTACQLCVSACPNGVLKPSSSLENFMQPEMSYNNGYCRPECVICGDVCPSRAITKIDTAQKSATQIGRAVWVEERCNVITKGEKCNNCERQCPTQAVKMIDRGFAHPVPVIDTEKCIGCGACENLCPSRPLSAIYVEGQTMHRTI